MQVEEGPPHHGKLLADSVPHHRLLVRGGLGLFMDRPIYLGCPNAGYVSKRAAPGAYAHHAELIARFQRHAYDVPPVTPTSVRF